jgi:hypothetical protein
LLFGLTAATQCGARRHLGLALDLQILRAGGKSVQLPCATSAAMPIDSPSVRKRTDRMQNPGYLAQVAMRVAFERKRVELLIHHAPIETPVSGQGEAKCWKYARGK